MTMAIKDRTRWQYAVTVVTGLALASFGCAGGSASGTTGTGGKGGGTGTGGAGTGGGGGNVTGSGGNATGSGGGGANGSGGASAQLSLPMVVTNFYNNQGWFGDAGVTAYFTPGSTIIKQANSSAGPCAARQPAALGNCLEVVYTPPVGLTQPDAGGPFVGVFLLTTLTMPHPLSTPPLKVGDPNWGDEPGKNIAPGATKISFQAAAATDGLMVTFKEGTANDSLTLPEQTETLTTSWKAYSMSIAGFSYGTSVAGAFAWILKDTTKPATFYLDGIVWE